MVLQSREYKVTCLPGGGRQKHRIIEEDLWSDRTMGMWRVEWSSTQLESASIEGQILHVYSVAFSNSALRCHRKATKRTSQLVLGGPLAFGFRNAQWNASKNHN